MKKISDTHFQLLFESAPGLYLILSPDLFIMAVSDAYLNATMTKRKEITGRHLFDVFPDNPDDLKADGVSNLQSSLATVLETKKAHTMAVQKYDIRNPDGTFQVRYWSPLNKPLLDDENNVIYIIHRVEDVTEFVRIKNEQALKEKLTDELKGKVSEMEMEIFKRVKEIQNLNNDLQNKVIERTEHLKKANEEIRKNLESLFNQKKQLEASEEKYRHLYENAIVAMFTTTVGTHISTEVNELGYKLFGYASKEDFVRNFNPSNHYVHPEERTALLETAKEQSEITVNERELKKLNGEIFWAKVFIKISDDKKTAQTLVLDITEQKRLEDEKRAYVKQLEEMMHITSHKVRQPIAHIIGISNLLENAGTSQPELEKLSGFMKQSALSLDDFTKELTEFMVNMNLKIKSGG